MMVCPFFTYIIVSFRWAKLYIDLRVTLEFVPGSVPLPGRVVPGAPPLRGPQHRLDVPRMLRCGLQVSRPRGPHPRQRSVGSSPSIFLIRLLETGTSMGGGRKKVNIKKTKKHQSNQFEPMYVLKPNQYTEIFMQNNAVLQ